MEMSCGRHHYPVAYHLELQPRQVGAGGDPLLAAASGEQSLGILDTIPWHGLELQVRGR